MKKVKEEQLVEVKAVLRVPGEPDKEVIASMPIWMALKDGWPLVDA